MVYHMIHYVENAWESSYNYTSCRRTFFFLFCKKEEQALVGTPIHHALFYAKMFYKISLAYPYTYRAT